MPLRPLRHIWQIAAAVCKGTCVKALDGQHASDREFSHRFALDHSHCTAPAKRANGTLAQG